MREMKDSGIEWIGMIPDGWTINKIGYIYEQRNEKVNDIEYQPLSVTKKGIVPQLESAAKSNDSDNRKLIKINDFVINSRSDRRGSCGISEYEGSCSLINHVLKPRNNMINRYYSFLFKTEQFADEFYKWGTGIVDDLWSTKWTAMKCISIPFPSLEEQQKIANYLDDKCSKIEDIIAKIQLSIEKLKEYKQAIITEAVTKGLDPDVEMKDSGVEWIGMIQKEAAVSKVKHYFEIILGKMLTTKPKNNDDTLEKYFSAVDVHFDSLSYTTEKQMWFSEKEKDLYRVKKGDLLIVEGGAAGTCHLVEKDVDNLYIQNSILITRSKKNISNKWLYYWLFSMVNRGYIEYSCNKATILHFTKDKLSNTPLVVIKDESKIIDYLDKKCSAIDESIIKKEKLIERLTEYKKSLIYEVVTGKREV